MPWYVGSRVRNRIEYLALLRERAERLEAEQFARARQAAADERARIARELHDVVAHQVSMMTVQAGAAKTVARSDIDAAIEAMGDVERAGRRTLGELRQLLGVLRSERDDPDDLGPQRGMDDISALVDDLRHAGVDVRADLPEIPPDVSAATGLAAYRVVQEAFTNVVKHAGPRPTVQLTVTSDAAEVMVVVTNSVRATSAPRSNGTFPASGYGITGLRERITLLGGTLTAGRSPDGTFVVRAQLPIRRETA